MLLAGGFPLRIRPRPSIIIIPSWDKRKLFVRCCGSYASSFPESYIPKKYRGEKMTWQCKEYFEKMEFYGSYLDLNLKFWPPKLMPVTGVSGSWPSKKDAESVDYSCEKKPWPLPPKILSAENELSEVFSSMSDGINKLKDLESVDVLFEKKSWPLPPKIPHGEREYSVFLNTVSNESNLVMSAESVDSSCERNPWPPKIIFAESFGNNLKKDLESTDSSCEKKRWPLPPKIYENTEFGVTSLNSSLHRKSEKLNHSLNTTSGNWPPNKNLKVEEVVKQSPKKKSLSSMNEKINSDNFSRPVLFHKHLVKELEEQNLSLEKKSLSSKNFNVEKLNNRETNKASRPRTSPKKLQARECTFDKNYMVDVNFSSKETDSCFPITSLKIPLKMNREIKFEGCLSSVSFLSSPEKKSQSQRSSVKKETWPSKNKSDAAKEDSWQPNQHYDDEEFDNLLGPSIAKGTNLPKESISTNVSSLIKKSRKNGSSFYKSPATTTMIPCDIIGDVMEYDKMEDMVENEGSPYAEKSINDLESDCSEISEEDAGQIRRTKQEAKNFALRALSKRVHTVVELKRKLQKQKFSFKVIEDCLAELHRCGWINDSLYADAYSLSKFSSLSWGPKRIERALLRKGVTTAQTKEARQRVFEGDDFDGNSLGMSKNAMDQLYAKTEKQWLRLHKDPLEKRKQKIVRWLQYREHKWDVINVILKKLQSYPS